jgi:hypothetical protein
MSYKKVVALFFTALLFVGICLLILDIIGLIIPLRNDSVISVDKLYFKSDITITSEAQLYNEIIRNIDESDEQYVSKVNTAINRGIRHYWEKDELNKYNVSVPIYENWLLYLRYGDKAYEYCDYRKGIERAIGLCSQHAIIVVGLLESKGFNAKIVGLEGHVVATVLVNGKWWILDPDFGVVIPYSIKEIENNPIVISNFYLSRGYSVEIVGTLIKAYSIEGNTVVSVVDYIGMWECLFERISYILIWVVPLLLILAFFINKLLTNKY